MRRLLEIGDGYKVEVPSEGQGRYDTWHNDQKFVFVDRDSLAGALINRVLELDKYWVIRVDGMYFCQMTGMGIVSSNKRAQAQVYLTYEQAVESAGQLRGLARKIEVKEQSRLWPA